MFAELDQQATNEVKRSYLSKLNKIHDQTIATIEGQMRHTQVTHRFTLLNNAIVVEGKKSDLSRLQALPNVVNVELDTPVYATMDKSHQVLKTATIWDQKDANNYAIMGKGMRIGIIDTGIDYSHADLGRLFRCSL